MDLFAQISSAAHDGDFGRNNRPEPSLPCVRAGNYRKGRVTWNGLRLAIETPQGQRRTGKANGEPWSVICQAHYGYIESTHGADGDPLDVFIGPWPESNIAYVVNQAKGDDSGFDEHKILLCFPDADSAITAYRNSYQQPRPTEMGVVTCSIDQLKWWLKYGNHAVPLTANQLPFDGTAAMNDVTWDSTANPVGMTVSALLYAMRRTDASDHLLLDAVTVDDVVEDSDGETVLDAIVVPLNRLERKLGQMQVIMRAAGKDVKPVALQITPPFKQKGTTNVAGIIEMSDGQSVTIYFHNPDATPNRLTPDDEMVSWKWMLNKKDVTIVVAPERGQELNPREVARRVMRMVEANSARFQAANTKRAERMAAINAGKAEIDAMQKELETLNAEIETLQVRVDQKRATPPAVLQRGGENGGLAEIRAVAFDPETRMREVRDAMGRLGWNVSPGSRDMTASIDGSMYGIKTETTDTSVRWLDTGSERVWENDPSLNADQMAAKIDSEFRGVIEAAKAAISRPAWMDVNPTTEEGYRIVQEAGEEALLYHQDQLDHFFSERYVAIRNALRVLGWADDGSRPMMSGPLKKGEYELVPKIQSVGPGRNVVGINYEIKGVPGYFMSDTLAHTPEQMAERINMGLPQAPSKDKDDPVVKAVDGEVVTMPSGDSFDVPPATFTGIKVVDSESDGSPAKVESQDGRFVWNVMAGDYIKDTVVGRSIYQMRYVGDAIGDSAPVPESVAGAVRAFFNAVDGARADAKRNAAISEPNLIKNPKYAGLSDEELKRLEAEYDKTHNEGGEGFNPYRDHLWIEGGNDPVVAEAVRLVREANGGIGKLVTSDYFTFDFEGDDMIFGDELRAKVESALGEKVKEVTLPGLDGQVSIVPESYQADSSSQPGGLRYKITKITDTKYAVGIGVNGDGGTAGAVLVQKNGRLKADYASGTSESRSLVDAAVKDVEAMLHREAEEMTALGFTSRADYEAHQRTLAASKALAAEQLAATARWNESIAYLQSVIDGTTDLSDPAVADKLTALYEAHNGTPTFDEMFAKAADAYQAFMVEAAKKVLGN